MKPVSLEFLFLPGIIYDKLLLSYYARAKDLEIDALAANGW